MCFSLYVINKKIALVGDDYCKPPTIIKFHNLHASDFRRAMVEIASYHERDSLPIFGPFGLCVFWPFFGLPFLSPLGWFWPLFFYWLPFIMMLFTSSSH